MNSELDTSRLTRAVYRRELLEQGHSVTAIRRAIAGNELIRLAHGVYAPTHIVGPHADDRHRLLARAVVAAATGQTALTGVSAAAGHGLPVWNMNLDRVHLARPSSGRGSKSSNISVIRRDIPESELVVVDGIPMTSAAWTVVDLAHTQERHAAVVTGDAALHRGLCTAAELTDVLARMRNRHGHQRAAAAVREMDGRSESALESRSRLVAIDGGLPPPRLQVEIVDAQGFFVARVDLLWDDERVVGECDGLGKYTGSYGSGSVHEVLRAEKFRAERLADEGYRVVRWTWAELATPELVVDRIRRALGWRTELR